MILLLFVLLLCGTTWAWPPGPVGPHVVISRNRLFYNNTEFWMRGMCYNPVPLGMQDMNLQDMSGGTGLCSPKLTAYGNWFSACYDSDFMNGSPAVGRDPPGPGGPNGKWFQAIWERDIPEIKKAGVNTIRMYNTNPTTMLAVRRNRDLFPDVTTPIDLKTGNEHVHFLDYVHQFDLKVLFPLYGDMWAIDHFPEEKMEEFLRNQIDEVGWHPAVLMYSVGNELPVYRNQTLLVKLNRFLKYAREYQFLRWGRHIPTTHAIVDYPDGYNWFFENLDVDVLTINNGYRGTQYAGVWTGDGGASRGLGRLACETGKPVFVGEIGQHTYDGSVGDPSWFPKIWKATFDAATQYSVIGGAFFEWNSEPMKLGPQQNMGMVEFSPSNSLNELGDVVTSRMLNVWAPDTLTYRDAPGAYNYYYITGLRRPPNGCGNPQDCNVNLSSDIFEYWGRDPYKIDEDFPWICQPYGIPEPIPILYDDPLPITIFDESEEDYTYTTSSSSSEPLLETSEADPPTTEETNPTLSTTEESSTSQEDPKETTENVESTMHTKETGQSVSGTKQSIKTETDDIGSSNHHEQKESELSTSTPIIPFTALLLFFSTLLFYRGT